MRRILALISTLSLFILVFTPLKLRSESLSVSMQVGTTQIIFSGYTSPNSFVVIKEDGVVISTTTANSLGDWTSTVTVSIPNIHDYAIYSTDSLGRTSASVEYSLNVAGNTTTTIENIPIPPTTSLSGNTLSGLTYPNSIITILVSSGPSYSLTAQSNGAWSFDLSVLEGGPHTITATTTIATIYISLASTPLTFTTPGPSPSSTPTPTISPSPQSTSVTSTPTPSPSPLPSPSSSPAPFFIELYDINKDGKLGSSELFEIIKSWLQKHLICDLNHDQKCNLIDLSILLYYIDR